MNTAPYISRLKAASMLHVSVRTLDRYIRRKGIKTKREGKNLLLLRSDVVALMPKDLVDTDIVHGLDETFMPNDTQTAPHNVPAAINQFVLVRKLFEDAQKQLERKEEKIEMLNYKLGQLEMKLKTSAPLLGSELSESVKEKEQMISSLQQKIIMLKLRKNIYLVLFFMISVGLSFVWFFLNRP